MILMRTTNNNGYGCSCCSRTWSDSDWMDEFLLPSFEEVVDAAICCEPYGEFGDTITCMYEKDGKVIYGYDIDVHKSNYTIYIWFGEEKYQFDTEGVNGLTKEQILKLYQ